MTSSLITRPRQSPWPAIPMDDALELIREHAPKPKIVEVKLADLKTGDVIAQDFHSPWPHPRFRTSRMDGYAFKSSDNIGQFQVLGGIEAGGSSAQSLQIPDRHCYRINTGGVVPDLADVVVPVEFTQLIKHDDQNELIIEIQKQMSSGQNIRQVGSDIAEGTQLLPSNTELGAAELALLASCAPNQVKIYERPKIGVLSTGDELVDSANGDQLKEGQIFDSNRLMLVEMFRSRGFEVWDGGIARDSRHLIKQTIIDCFHHCDILVMSGGVSMGDKDLLKPILAEDLNLRIHFGRVFMKPGLPSTFASGQLEFGKTGIVFGLPGNPVSAFVSAHLFVMPMVRYRMGQEWKKAMGTMIKVKINRDYKLDFRPEYVRACLQFTDSGLPIGQIVESNQVSSRLISVSHVNLLLKLPQREDSKTEIKEGEVVEAIVIDRV